jgi:threonine aldolase
VNFLSDNAAPVAVATDECGAPEGGGLKLIGLPGEDGKVAAETLKRALGDNFGHSPHQMIASALSITQASEAGTVYRLDEIAALCQMAQSGRSRSTWTARASRMRWFGSTRRRRR